MQNGNSCQIVVLNRRNYSHFIGFIQIQLYKNYKNSDFISVEFGMHMLKKFKAIYTNPAIALSVT